MSAASIPDPEAGPDASDAAFEVRRATPLVSPLVFSSPHSGRVYPEDMMAASTLDGADIRRSEDALVDGLVERCAGYGAALVLCRVARAYVDVNRDPWEMDPSMFADELPAAAKSSTARVAAGLGAVPRVVGEGREIYGRKLRFAEADARIQRVHRPYHLALAGLIDEAHARFGHAVLVDWHSMPSAAGAAEARKGRPKPDMVLGDRHGASCAPPLTRLVKRELEAAGYVVALNRPYAGGWTTQLHGRPEAGFHALQVEIDRGLYLDERTLEPRPGFARLRDDLERLFAVLGAQDWSRVLAGA
ncbi:MAG TPA: N-formylglutamate amidohydrolase [Caulobacteraceae bacterium]|nr:N-formylglutamate amidohydrolase [Caulobacteraceae bacterium]